jgi:uncharacterized protein YegL
VAHAAYPLRQDDRTSTDSTRQWIITPVCLSVLLHCLVLSTVQNMDWLGAVEPERQLNRMYTIQTGTVRPEDLERMAMAPEPATEEVYAVRGTADLTPDMFPDKTDDGPRQPVPEAKPTLRYPEEELPIVSTPGLSERSRAFVRDGELKATELSDDTIRYIPSGRTIGRGPSDTVMMRPELREAPDALAKSIAGGASPLLEAGTAPSLTIEAPSTEGVGPDVSATSLGREAEQLFTDDGTPVKMKPIPLNVKIDVFAEPGSNYRFFRLTVREKNAGQLPVIAKNVLFVVDISASIRLEMLRRVQRGLANSAGGFNRGDGFNIVRFSEQTYKAFGTFVDASQANIARGAATVRKEPGQVRTDVYTAIKKVIAELPTSGEGAFRPTNIYLVSDGNPTTGIQEIRKIVNDISQVTRSNYSVFALNPGAHGANAYMLDLLAYRNRGVYRRAKTVGATDARLLAMLMTYKSPVLMKLRAQYGNFEVDQVYPQTLPNLYSGHPIVIYGRCRPGDQIAVRIIGDSAKDRRKFLYTSALPDVLTKDKSIAGEWARGKIHHLTSLIAREGEKKAYTDEIRRLSKRYGVDAPYK